MSSTSPSQPRALPRTGIAASAPRHCSRAGTGTTAERRSARRSRSTAGRSGSAAASGQHQGQAEEQGQRARVMMANTSSARFRLDMIDGKRAPFVEEAEALEGGADAGEGELTGDRQGGGLDGDAATHGPQYAP